MISENTFSSDERIAVVREIFQSRIGGIDWTKTGAPAWCITVEEAEQLLNLVPLGRQGIGLVVECINRIAARLRKDVVNLHFHDETQIVGFVQNEISVYASKNENYARRGKHVTEAALF